MKKLQYKFAALEVTENELVEKLERLEIQEATKRALDEVDRGMGTPVREWAKKVRAKYRLPQS